MHPKQAGKQTDRQTTDRHSCRQASRQAGRQADRQTDREAPLLQEDRPRTAMPLSYINSILGSNNYSTTLHQDNDNITLWQRYKRRTQSAYTYIATNHKTHVGMMSAVQGRVIHSWWSEHRRLRSLLWQSEAVIIVARSSIVKTRQ